MCCFAGEDSEVADRALFAAEVESVGEGTLGIRLESPIRCWGGAECSPADFPAELLEGVPNCGFVCTGCDDLAVGDTGMFVIDLPTACVWDGKRVTAGAEPTVACLADGGPIPLDFALEQGLREHLACWDAYLESDPCGEEGTPGCGSAGGGPLDLLAILLLVALWRLRRARARGTP